MNWKRPFRLPVVVPAVSVIALLIALCVATGPVVAREAPEQEEAPRKTFDVLSRTSATCVSCHIEDDRGLYQQWGRSKHYGANVGCYECHRAEPGDPDAFMHKKSLIAVIVSPKDCGRCHEDEFREFTESSHAQSGEIKASPAHALASVAQSMPGSSMTAAALHGCHQCHGSKVRVRASGKLEAETWPNSGIGRINPDGSRGACTACHQRHEFSQVQARRPEACGKCHRGPAHPQKEIYDESKHGINFYANVDRMNLHSAKWVAGEDYDSGPTCATCHMSATTEAPLTHNVGRRVSWNLRAPVSHKVGQQEGREDPDIDWRENRDRMQEVCISCHTEKLVENFYKQYDSVVVLYNAKFARPGEALMEILAQTALRTPVEFDEAIEWTWFNIWHQAGRRVRQGASMQAPDYVQWQGFYEIAQRFYMDLLPQAEALIAKGRAAGRQEAADRASAMLEEIRNRPEHAWSLHKP